MQRELFCSALSASSWPNQAGEDSIILNWCSTLRMTTQNSMDVLTAKTRPSLSISRPLWWWNGCNQAQRLREPAREPESTLGTMKWRTNVLNCVWPSASTSEIRFSRRQLHIIATAHGVSSFPPTTQTHSNAFTLLIHSRTRFQDWNFALRLCTQQSSRLLMAHFQG